MKTLHTVELDSDDIRHLKSGGLLSLEDIKPGLVVAYANGKVHKLNGTGPPEEQEEAQVEAKRPSKARARAYAKKWWNNLSKKYKTKGNVNGLTVQQVFRRPHIPKNGLYRCRVCESPFKDWRELKAHILETHVTERRAS